MIIIGITGPSGGGKTSALHALRSLGALIIDCDAVYHELLSGNDDMLREIGANFEGVVTGDTLDRKALGKIVFSEAAALETLNEITHKFVKVEVDRRLKEYEDKGGALAAVDAIALVESGLAALCGLVVGVTAPEETRVRRIMARDSVSEEYARLRVGAQKPELFFYENCDYVLISDCDTVEEFEAKCKVFFMGILGGMHRA
ncbi:dephospho-CoA kinase [Sporobacter termitidis DSM 10068]|uniref:Dephospho-CoA kinase n=1 Tax=Sporobacter termitidis DSM 10068 TaxID=1123282 RepID=A0A1M5WU26_9FIRM|nr:dephospho-CoA kinase [Sporobacter termitidis]SHH91087.1 dephospho-CoA kinase [Sporobacter termitidis DSM 10068]